MNGYIGVNNVAKKIKTMYIGINGLARKVKIGYVGDSSGKSRKWYNSELPPNERYESKSLGTWSSLSQVNNFLSTHNHDNNYIGLSLGNYVTIQDGTYNTDWVIAGFDCEHNQTAADGTVYDNGYGILMIPKTELDKRSWYYTYVKTVSYINSDIHAHINADSDVLYFGRLKKVLGNHIIQRNVLLGSDQNGITYGGAGTSAYTWTTSYLTLMSVGQMNGRFARNNNKYDDGEANYKLPLFNYEGFSTGSVFWTRCVYGLTNTSAFDVWFIHTNGSLNYTGASGVYGIRPLMLLR